MKLLSTLAFFILSLLSSFSAETRTTVPSEVPAVAALLIEKPGNIAISPSEKVSIEEKGSQLIVRRPAPKGGVVFEVVKGWKLYTDKENILWFFDGQFELVRMEFSDKNIAFQQGSVSKELWDEAPKAFTELLPKTRLRPLPKKG